MIHLGTPTWGRLDHRMVECAFRDKTPELVEQWDIVASPLIAANRNVLLNKALKHEPKYIVQVDDDVWWGPNVLWFMMKVLDQCGTVVYVDMPDRQMQTTAYNWKNNEITAAPYHPDPFRSDAFGSGMFGMTWQFAKTLPRHPFDLLYRNGYQRREDLSFSIVLERMDIRPVCLPNMNVIHYCEYRGKRPRSE